MKNMKNLNEPLENGLVPIVEIAKIIFKYDDRNEPYYVDFSKPEFYDGKLFVAFCGDKIGCGITKYLYFEENQFKIKVYDSYWTSDTSNIYSAVVEYNQVELLRKLIELGVATKEDVGF
jgi:hypothetical protein